MGAWVKRPRSLLRYRRRRASRRQPYEPRSSRGFERQRLRAVALIDEWRAEIHDLAGLYKISADAIAGAILWDALENPYRRPLLRLGPGKVHPCELGQKSDAERAEEAGLVAFAPGGAVDRLRILRRPEGALAYIAAILAYHAANYEAIAGVDIRADPAILCTLYQGGASEARAASLARRRSQDPAAKPRAADEMGPWVESQRAFIRTLLAPPGHAPLSASAASRVPRRNRRRGGTGLRPGGREGKLVHAGSRQERAISASSSQRAWTGAQVSESI